MTAALPIGHIVAVIADVLRRDPEHIDADTVLYDLPGFDSLALVTILARLEDALGAEIPAEWIVPEAFASVGALASLLEAAAGVASGAGDRP
jgi:acyl carrier protein